MSDRFSSLTVGINTKYKYVSPVDHFLVVLNFHSIKLDQATNLQARETQSSTARTDTAFCLKHHNQPTSSATAIYAQPSRSKSSKKSRTQHGRPAERHRRQSAERNLWKHRKHRRPACANPGLLVRLQRCRAAGPRRDSQAPDSTSAWPFWGPDWWWWRERRQRNPLGRVLQPEGKWPNSGRKQRPHWHERKKAGPQPQTER